MICEFCKVIFLPSPISHLCTNFPNKSSAEILKNLLTTVKRCGILKAIRCMMNTTVETAAKKMKSPSRETLQADGVQSRQTLFVRYCPRFVQDCFKKLRRQNALLRSMDWEEGIWENPRKS